MAAILLLLLSASGPVVHTVEVDEIEINQVIDPEFKRMEEFPWRLATHWYPKVCYVNLRRYSEHRGVWRMWIVDWTTFGKVIDIEETSTGVVMLIHGRDHVVTIKAKRIYYKFTKHDIEQAESIQYPDYMLPRIEGVRK